MSAVMRTLRSVEEVNIRATEGKGDATVNQPGVWGGFGKD